MSYERITEMYLSASKRCVEYSAIIGTYKAIVESLIEYIESEESVRSQSTVELSKKTAAELVEKFYKCSSLDPSIRLNLKKL